MVVTSDKEFFIERQKAVERMKEMSERFSKQNMPPAPPFVKTENGTKESEKTGNKKTAPMGISSLPFLNGTKPDGDTTLILGLILLLYAEQGDRLLLYALLYILF